MANQPKAIQQHVWQELRCRKVKTPVITPPIKWHNRLLTRPFMTFTFLCSKFQFTKVPRTSCDPVLTFSRFRRGGQSLGTQNHRSKGHCITWTTGDPALDMAPFNSKIRQLFTLSSRLWTGYQDEPDDQLTPWINAFKSLYDLTFSLFEFIRKATLQIWINTTGDRKLSTKVSSILHLSSVTSRFELEFREYPSHDRNTVTIIHCSTF